MVVPVLPDMRGREKDGEIGVGRDNCLSQAWLKYFAYTNFTKHMTM